MIAIRLSKIVVTAGLALYAFLVALGNVVDDSNWIFLRHVLAMDTVFPDSTLRTRAITDPGLQRAAYLVIIGFQVVIGLVLTLASLLMARALTASQAAFRRAKSVTALGILLGFGLWFIGFTVIAGEWFAMWQSSEWNAQTTAYRITLVFLAAGIYVLLDNDGAPEPPPRAE